MEITCCPNPLLVVMLCASPEAQALNRDRNKDKTWDLAVWTAGMETGGRGQATEDSDFSPNGCTLQAAKG